MAEYFDIVDEQGQPTGEIIERSTAHQQGIRHRTVHIWLLRQKNGRIQILLQKRCAAKDSFPNCYDISSAGHIPAGEDFLPSALRELKEELGLTVQPEELIVCGDRSIIADEVFHGKPFHDREQARVFILWKDKDEKDFRLQEEEVDSVLWMDFEQCMEGVRQNTFRHCIHWEELMLISHQLKDKCPCQWQGGDF